jgi:hypothetical protein
MRKEEEEEVIAREYMDTLKGIEIIEDAVQRKDWINQMDDLRKFYEEISGRTITIELPEVEVPNPENIKQTLFSHEDKPENVEVIREEQDARGLHQEIKERLQLLDNNMEKVKKMEQERLKETKRMKKEVNRGKRKQNKIKEVRRIETSSDEYEKLSDTEEEKEKEPPYHIDGESKKMLRAAWKNEIETYEEKTLPRINARHFKKIRNGLNLLMIKTAAIFRMLNDTNEEDEEYIQEAYTYVTFLLTKHIQDKIGKKIPKGNVFRKIPKRKTYTTGEKIEGKNVEGELRETQIRSDKTLKMMNDIVANFE